MPRHISRSQGICGLERDDKLVVSPSAVESVYHQSNRNDPIEERADQPLLNQHVEWNNPPTRSFSHNRL